MCDHESCHTVKGCGVLLFLDVTNRITKSTKLHLSVLNIELIGPTIHAQLVTYSYAYVKPIEGVQVSSKSIVTATHEMTRNKKKKRQKIKIQKTIKTELKRRTQHNKIFFITKTIQYNIEIYLSNKVKL